MLDVNGSLFNVNLPSINATNSKALIITGCRAIINITNKDIYSEFDELNYY